MEIKSVLEKIYTKTYYIGEAHKRENANAGIIQACADNDDVLMDYISMELEEINFYAKKRLVEFAFNEGKISVESSRPKADEMKGCMEKLLSDYLVEYASYRWLNDNGVNYDSSIKDESLHRLKDCICSLAPRVRRRATNMGI